MITGSLVATAPPLIALLHLHPGSLPFFLAAALGGALIYTSSPVMVVAAQDLAPNAPAAASGVVLGLTTGVAGGLYVALGRLQETIGLTEGMTVGFAMVIPAAAIALAVLLRHPRAAGRAPTPRPDATVREHPLALTATSRHGAEADDQASFHSCNRRTSACCAATIRLARAVTSAEDPERSCASAISTAPPQ